MRVWTGLFALFMCLPALSHADAVVATRMIRSQTVLRATDVSVRRDLRGDFATPEDVIGMETRRAIYAGQVLQRDAVGPPALVTRNQIITLVYRKAGLTIVAAGRSLGRAASGEVVRVLNLDSRVTIAGIVLDDGRVLVGTPERQQ